MAKWLVKSEPNTYSIGDLKRDRSTLWDGVRNYQARNFLREMKRGDQVLFYHSVTKPVGVAGVCKVVKEAYPDPTQFDRKSSYFDPKASQEQPRWFCPDLGFVEAFQEVVTLEELREVAALSEMRLLQRGNRLSVMPVTAQEFSAICRLGRKQARK